MKKLFVFFMSILFLTVFTSIDTQAATFKDVPKDKYYYSAVEWGYKNKIIGGDGKGNFLPNQPVRHPEFLKMFSEFYKIEKSFDGYEKMFDEYYAGLEYYNVYFDLDTEYTYISRGEVAALIAFSQNQYRRAYDIYNYHFILRDADKIVKYMFDNKLSNGVPTKSTNLVDRYGFEQTLTRAEAIQFLFNLKAKGFDTLKAKSMHAEKFNEQAAIVRTYTATNNVQYHVLSDDYSKYRAVFVYNGYAIGGYESENGKNFNGVVIGKPKTLEDYTTENIDMAPLVDRHNNDNIHALYWITRDPKYHDLFEEALSNKSENQHFLNLIYTDLINEFRAQYGEAALEYHPDLAKAAYLHSVDMATNDFFSHTNLKGESPSARVSKINPALSAGENIAAGYSHIFIAHIEWINSYGHRSNMLDSSYTHVGFGDSSNWKSHYGRYFTVNLH